MTEVMTEVKNGIDVEKIIEGANPPGRNRLYVSSQRPDVEAAFSRRKTLREVKKKLQQEINESDLRGLDMYHIDKINAMLLAIDDCVVLESMLID